MLKGAIELLTASWPVQLTIFLASTTLLALDSQNIGYADSLPDWAMGVGFVAAIVSASVLVAMSIRSVASLASRPFRERARSRAREADIARLHDLSEGEFYVLSWATANNLQVFPADYHHPMVQALRFKGLLANPGGHHYADRMPHAIPDHVWRYLKENISGEPNVQQLTGTRLFEIPR